MEIIRYIADDFVLTVECHSVAYFFGKASKKIHDIHHSTEYLTAGESGKLFILNLANGESLSVLPGSPHHPVFFENADYIIDVEFKNPAIEKARVYSRLKEITERFSSKQRKDIYTLTGTVNYGNDIGKYDFVLRYENNGIKKEFCFTYEVFPTKLDYKRDYRKIVADIEAEYTHLVLAFLKKTYSNFQPDSSTGNDLIWWSVFGTVYKELLQSAKFILNKPHSRLISHEEYCKRDKIRKLTPALEEKLILYNDIPNKLYRTSNTKLTTDTTENRFFKYVLKDVERKFNRIKDFIQKNRQYVISPEFNDELNEIGKSLQAINYHPFFKSVGAFKGIAQESLVLQKKNGYASVYRNWILLKRGLNLFDGIQKIDLENIAELYQIWCFLKMKGIIKSILNREPQEVDLAEVQVDNFLFTLKKGKASRVVFVNDRGDQIELYHDYTFKFKSSSENLSFTVDQRPDIVLKVTKNDLKENYAFTYLYDAKYRLKSDEKEEEPDFPPNDAINQMHRYRDAIYYLDKESKFKGKEVIGGYILFPGSGTVEDIKRRSFFTSVKDVNIGAYPLVPNDTYESQQLLKEHLAEIIDHRSDNILREVIPQKGMVYENPDALVLAGFLSSDNQKAYFQSGSATIYHMPVYKRSSGKVNSIRNLDKLKFLCPINDGITEYYEIVDIKVLPRKEVFEMNHAYGLYKNDDSSYYVFTLSNRKSISKIAVSQGGNRLFRYATLSELRKAKSISDFNKFKQENF